ncbi:MAG TPA: glycosyltransferase [Streptosporangiaceae bacterium]
MTDPGATIQPLLSVVISAHDEGSQITGVLDGVFSSVRTSCEVLVVVDSRADSTAGAVVSYAAAEPRLTCLVNPGGGGSAGAIRFGMAAAKAPVIVVMAAGGTDDPQLVDELAALVRRGAVVASASRYASGASGVPAIGRGWRPFLTAALSRFAGRSLDLVARAGTCDATYPFKAYSAQFARTVAVEAARGDQIGIELTAKARRLRLPVAEIPVTFPPVGPGRRAAPSGLALARALPGYLRWYLFCFGPSLTPGRLAAHRPKGWPDASRAAAAQD